MRKEMPRLKSVSLKKKLPDYIHLYFLTNDIKEALNRYASGSLLDLGCGNKPYKEWYASLTTENTGCDAIQSTEQIVDTICLATDLSYANNTFDTVFSTQVLEHVYDHHGMVKEAYRVLKHGGNIILTVPFTWELHEEPYDFFRISKHGLKELFEEAGFEIITIKANGGKWAAMFQMMLNTVYSTFKYRTIRARVLKIIFMELRFTWLINHLAIWADKKYRDDVWTLNYIVVAKKEIMKSVLFFSLMDGGAWGGSEEIWYRTALWMADNNYSVGICCYDWDEKKVRLQELEKRGCSLYLLPEKKILKQFLGKRKLESVVEKIPFEKYDLVFVNQGGWSDVLHSPFKYLYNRFNKFAMCSHNYNVNEKFSNRKISIYNEWVSRSCVNIGDAGKIFEVLKNYYNILVPRQEAICNPITFNVPKKPTAYPLNENNIYVWIMLAEFDIARKAQDVLVKTLSSEKWKKRNWVLHFYGKGKDQSIIQKLIDDCGLQERISLKGHTNNVQEALSSCHLLFQVTHIDAMPISVVEAMSIARPCIVSNVGDMTKWVHHGTNGFVSEVATVENIDSVLEECWSKKDSWKLLGENAFQTFTEKYPQPYEEKMATLLKKYYNQ